MIGRTDEGLKNCIRKLSFRGHNSAITTFWCYLYDLASMIAPNQSEFAERLLRSFVQEFRYLCWGHFSYINIIEGD